MRRQTYERLKIKDPKFDSKWVQTIPIDDVVLDKLRSQIRKDGAVLQKIPQMVEDIKENDQQIPVSVKRLPNGKYELKDGITRLEAIKQLDRDLKISTYHDDIFTTSDEWIWHQIESNNHETATSHSAEDIAHQVQMLVSSGALERQLEYKYLGNEVLFMKEAPQLLKKRYKGLTTINRLKTALKNVVAGTLLPGRYEPYDQTKALDMLERYNKFNWTGSSVGHICNNACAYTFRNERDRKDLWGNTFKKLHDNPNLDVYVVVWVGTLTGLDDNGLKKQRQKLYDLIKVAQNHNKGWGPMFKGVFFLPQFLTGPNKENMYKLCTPQELSLK